MANFVAYTVADGTGRSRIGHYDFDKSTIVPLSYASGTPLSSLYEVFEIGSESVIAGGEPFPADAVQILPPLSGRDVLAVGKNYSEHAKEFNASGYDASDKVDMPTHPVIFTKRATSIISNEEEILLHPHFTQTLDYEGEIGVIIGKGGFQISESDAPKHVWGYTIINDVTAREKQRDHKQFYIGKSGDTFCPMGPIARPAEHLPEVLRVETRVNGELRQQGTTEDLIFSVPNLIKTLSESQTLQPGDVIATGTPAGVGFGLKPPQFLKEGDLVEVSITGLGTLRNRIAKASAPNHVADRLAKQSVIPIHNLSITNGGQGLTKIGSKLINIRITGPDSAPPIIFIHGLGGSTTTFTPLINHLRKTHRCITYDLEGHGLTPTKASSTLSIQSYANDLLALQTHLLPSPSAPAILIAHSMGCLVAATHALAHPSRVSNLILLGPPPSPLPAAASQASNDRAAAVRAGGMSAVAEAVAMAGTSEKTKRGNPLAYAAVLQSLLAQHPEGYAKGCAALAGSSHGQGVEWGKLAVRTLVVTGDEDRVCTPQRVEGMVKGMGDVRKVVLEGVGHWHAFEDVHGAAKAVEGFLGDGL